LLSIFWAFTEFNAKSGDFKKVNDISQLPKFHDISWYNHLLSFSFDVNCWLSPFDALKSWPQNFGFVQTDSKFWNFGLCYGES